MKWNRLLFWTWLATAMQSCCFCAKLVTCLGSGYKVTFADPCCMAYINEITVTRYRLKDTTDRKTFRFDPHFFIAGKQMSFNLNEVLLDLENPDLKGDTLIEGGRNYEGQALLTKHMVEYGFLIENRKRNWQHRIAAFELKESRRDPCGDCRSYNMLSAAIDGKRREGDTFILHP